MNQRIHRCLECFWLGYFRVEKARGGGTTFFHPETLPKVPRVKIFQEDRDGFLATLKTLNARDGKLACLSEKIEPDGQRCAVEEAYDASTPETSFDDIASLMNRPRDCAFFKLFDPLLKYSDAQLLDQKETIEKLVAQEEKQRRSVLLTELREEFLKLEADSMLSPQTRGKLFESWLARFFEVWGFQTTLDIVNDWEQIDFTFWLGNLFVVAEARWLSRPVDSPQVRDFFGKLLDRPPFVIGLLISVSGFTDPSLKWLSNQSGNRTVLRLTRIDLMDAMAGTDDLDVILMSRLSSVLEHLW